MSNMCLKIFLGGLFICLAISSVAQNRAIDSLRNVLKTQQDDTAKANTLNRLSEKLWRTSKYDTALVCAISAQNLADKSDSKKAKATAFKNIGTVYYYKGDFPLALQNVFQALNLNRELGDKIAIVSNISELGLIYNVQGNYAQAMEHFFQALKLAENISDKKDIATILGNIGTVYDHEGNYNEALGYHLKAIAIYEQLNNKTGLATQLTNVGGIYINQGDHSKGLDYELRALKLNMEIDDKNAMAYNLGDIGGMYDNQHDYNKALEYVFKALALFKQVKNEYGITLNYMSAGNIYITQKLYKKAAYCLDSALTMAKKIGAKKFIQTTYGQFALLDSAKGDYKASNEDYKKFVLYKDSLSSMESISKIAQLEQSHRMEITEDSIKVEQEKRDIIKNAETKRKNIILYGGLIILFITIALLALYLQTKRKKDRIIFEKERNLLSLEKQKVEDELSNAKTMLDKFTHNMVERNKLIEQFQIDLDKIRMVLDFEVESALPFSMQEAVVDFIVIRQNLKEKESTIYAEIFILLMLSLNIPSYT